MNPVDARITVVIPILNEERLLPGLLRHLARIGGWQEVIVADGGSRDRSAAIAYAHGAGLVSAVGLHAQLAAGLSAATGDLVLILGADMRPCASTPRLLRTTRAVAGCLRLRHARRSPLFRWGDAVARLRARWTRCAYLDQAPFVARAAALARGSFRPFATYATAELMRRLRSRGGFALLPATVVTSCRAWDGDGMLRTFLRYQRNRARHLAGIDRRWPMGWTRVP